MLKDTFQNHINFISGSLQLLMTNYFIIFLAYLIHINAKYQQNKNLKIAQIQILY